MEIGAKAMDNGATHRDVCTVPMRVTQEVIAPMSSSAPKRNMSPSPNSSFLFDTQEWVISTRLLTLAEKGRLFTSFCEALANKDREFFLRYRNIVPRVYWREKPSRPSIPPSVRKAILARDGGACVWCSSNYKIEIDHIVPWSKGGTHDAHNLRVLCKPCNRRKGARFDA